MENKKVVIIGGGVAGMSAAHELVERGYTVEVYEKNIHYAGGKARSVDYKGEQKPGYENPLPGEHGFRFFPGFYKHVIDTMKRIPFGAGQTVFDNLTPTSRIMIARNGKPPIVTDASFPKNISDLKVIIKDVFGTDTGLTKDEEKFFAERVWQLITSSNSRRHNDYEQLGWWQYLEADRFSKTYQSLLVQGLTRTLVAARAETASTKTGGNIFLQLIFNMTDPTVNTDRVLNGPTNDKWLNPWSDYLAKKGVLYFKGCEAIKININSDEMITSVTIRKEDGSTIEAKGDHYILATPVERAAALIHDQLIKADHTLDYIKTLAPSVSWMNGIQFFLNEEVPINKGHVIYSDSEWAVTSISQVQFWKDYDITTKGNNKVKGVLSVDVSDWFSPGKYTTTKCADECTKEEIKNEVWAQLKNSLNTGGTAILRDDMIEDFYLDRDIEIPLSINDKLANQDSNREPLLVNMVNTWTLRPDASSDIPNLFLAGDYIRTFTDLATMEGANESARRAVNAILDKDRSNAPKCKIWPMEEPNLFKPLKWYDKTRWDKGLPWSMHVPLWLKGSMVIWGVVCLTLGLVETVTKKILK